jgi:tRNA 2-selenouridine synthase SelU
MRKGISKNRAKGAEYGRIKSHEKLERKLEDKKRVNQIENAKKNAIRRKEKEEKRAFEDLVDEIKIIDFIKNSFIILKEGETEKRVLRIPKELTKKTLDRAEDLITLTLYGEEISLSELDCNDDVLDKLYFYLEDKVK